MRNIGGVALVQAAVRRLTRRARVRVLHPDPALERHTMSIPEMAHTSGGEQLTGAILFYCTLARVCARSRGLTHRPSSVLVLDNPIERASRLRFLEVQREVARAMGVQLVYTTAVNDHEALRALPSIIRLRVRAGAEVEAADQVQDASQRLAPGARLLFLSQTGHDASDSRKTCGVSTELCMSPDHNKDHQDSRRP